MARIGLLAHAKFRRLAARIGGDRARALGLLEMMWGKCYESVDDYLGDAFDVESAAEWIGEPGQLAAALLDAGGAGRAGFIEEIEGGYYRVHDLWHHAPDYVQKRLARETARRERGESLSQARAAAGARGRAVQLSRQKGAGQADAETRQADAAPIGATEHERCPPPTVSSGAGQTDAEHGQTDAAPPAKVLTSPPRPAPYGFTHPAPARVIEPPQPASEPAAASRSAAGAQPPPEPSAQAIPPPAVDAEPPRHEGHSAIRARCAVLLADDARAGPLPLLADRFAHDERQRLVDAFLVVAVEVAERKQLEPAAASALVVEAFEARRLALPDDGKRPVWRADSVAKQHAEIRRIALGGTKPKPWRSAASTATDPSPDPRRGRFYVDPNRKRKAGTQ